MKDKLIWQWKYFLNYIGIYHWKEKPLMMHNREVEYIKHEDYLVIFKKYIIQRISYSDITPKGRTLEALLEKYPNYLKQFKKSKYSISYIKKESSNNLGDEKEELINFLYTYWNPNKNRGKFIKK